MTEEVEEKISTLVPVAVKLSSNLLMAIDDIVATGRYASRSEFVRAAVRLLLNREKR